MPPPGSLSLATLPRKRGRDDRDDAACSEVVNWLLLRAPIQVAQADIDAFAKLFPMMRVRRRRTTAASC